VAVGARKFLLVYNAQVRAMLELRIVNSFRLAEKCGQATQKQQYDDD